MHLAITLALLFSVVDIQAHSGRTNADGCHAGSEPYHCHNSGTAQPPRRAKASEATYNKAFCASLNGQTETRHYYNYPGGRGYIVVDCETATHVWEGGLDKRSSLDSVQQALFSSLLVGKKPGVVIYDTDDQIGKYEHRIGVAADLAGVDFLIR